VHAMFDAIRDVHAGGTSILLVEQNVAEALANADRAYLLEEGRIVSEGTPETVFGDPALRRAYLGAATGP
jgi:branched-chain amino acid transport system ATP-binding protein